MVTNEGNTGVAYVFLIPARLSLFFPPIEPQFIQFCKSNRAQRGGLVFCKLSSLHSLLYTMLNEKASDLSYKPSTREVSNTFFTHFIDPYPKIEIIFNVLIFLGYVAMSVLFPIPNKTVVMFCPTIFTSIFSVAA